MTDPDLSGLGLSGIREWETSGGVPLITADLPDGTYDQVWRELRDRHERTGWWPVLTWAAHLIAEESGESWANGYTRAELAEARKVDPATRMTQVIRWAFEGVTDDYDPGEAAELWSEEYDPAVLAARLEPLADPPPPGRRRETGAVRGWSCRCGGHRRIRSTRRGARSSSTLTAATSTRLSVVMRTLPGSRRSPITGRSGGTDRWRSDDTTPSLRG